MTLFELGAIGELVGGIAIIISLIYVGIQIRQSTNANRVATAQAFSKQYSDLNQMFIDPQVRIIFTRGLNGLEDLETEERVGFMAVLSSISRTLESFYFQTLSGGLDGALFDGWLLQYLDLLENRGAMEFWAVRKHQYTSEFVTYLDKKIKDHNASPLYGLGNAEKAL